MVEIKAKRSWSYFKGTFQLIMNEIQSVRKNVSVSDVGFLKKFIFKFCKKIAEFNPKFYDGYHFGLKKLS